jgi:hypothetical protein
MTFAEVMKFIGALAHINKQFVVDFKMLFWTVG